MAPRHARPAGYLLLPSQRHSPEFGRMRERSCTVVDGPLVSVIIPACNAAATVATSVESVLAQTYGNLEILVVDDGSQDGTAEVVRSLAGRDERVVLLQQPNRGVAMARNAAIERASGEYIAPLDADDIWYATKIENQVRRMERGGPSLGLVYCWWDVLDRWGRHIARSHPWRREGRVAEALLAMNFVGNASVPLFRRACIDVVGPYDPAFHAARGQGCEDWDLALRISEHFDVGVVPERLVGYRQVAGSMSDHAAAMIRSHELMLDKVVSRRPYVPPPALRWSRGQLHGYLVMASLRTGAYRNAAGRLLRAVRLRTVSFGSPLMTERLLGGWLRGPRPASEPGGNPADRAGGIMVMSNAVQLAVTGASVAVLARLLTPRDFGVFAMVAVVLGLVANLRDFGIPAAVIRSRAIADVDLNRLFWLNLRLGVLLALCTTAAAPLLAWFFAEPALLGITLAMTLGGLVASASALHLGLLARAMRFRAVAASEIGATALGALAGIVAAVRGAGYWALVIQHVTMMGVVGTMPWLLCQWRPRGYASAGSPRVRSLLAYGTSLSLARVVVYATQSIGFVVVGRLLGATALGLYQSAYRWATLPVQQVYKPLDQVVVSSLRPLQQDIGAYRLAMTGTIRATAALIFPVLAVLAVGAHDAVLLLLGAQWLDAVPLFRVLAAAAFLDVVRLSCKWLHLSEGRTDRQLRWALFSMPVILLGTALGVAFGELGVAIGFAAAVLVLTIPTAIYALATSPLSPREFWGALAYPAAAALLAVLLAAAALPFLDATSPAVRLALVAALLGTGYIAAWLIMPGGRAALLQVLQRARVPWPAQLRLRRLRQAAAGKAV
jgi:O-antigen/teichoic acid export membrane protein/glycosyltransferase involved in cell wall biosynthesis